MPDAILTNSDLLLKIHKEFEKAKSRETDQKTISYLHETQFDLFDKNEIFNNSILEIRLRCYIAENRLLSLESMKRNQTKQLDSTSASY